MGKKIKLDLAIDKIEHKSQYSHPEVPFSDTLPQHPFTMLIVAPPGSGKTNFLCNLIIKQYKKYFHRVLVSSPSIMIDEKWEVVQETKDVLKKNKKLEKALNNDSAKEGKIKKVVWACEGSLREQVQKKQKWDGKIPENDFFPDLESVPARVNQQQVVIDELEALGKSSEKRYLIDRQLLILDDQAGMYKQGTNNPLNNLVIKHRHTSTSMIIVTQAYKAIPRTIRTSCNALVLFEIPNLKELTLIYEEYPEGMDYKEWLQVYKHATSESFNFLYLNNKFPKGLRVFKNFDSRLEVSKVVKPVENVNELGLGQNTKSSDNTRH